MKAGYLILPLIAVWLWGGLMTINWMAATSSLHAANGREQEYQRLVEKQNTALSTCANTLSGLSYKDLK